MPRWHEAGSIKIDNPEELKSKLIRSQEMLAIKNYYNKAGNSMSWRKMLVDGENAGGAVYAKEPNPRTSGYVDNVYLVTYNHTKPSDNGIIASDHDDGRQALRMYGLMCNLDFMTKSLAMAYVRGDKWIEDVVGVYYMAIVEKRF